MIYLLDSNVLSELWKPKPDDVVVAWFCSSDWYLPVPVIAEIQEGAEASPSAARRREINAKLDAFLKTHGHGDGLGCGIGADMGPIETFAGSETQTTSLLGQPD